MNGWLEGDYPVTITAILSMIADLPREARYPTLLAFRRKQAERAGAPIEEPDPDPDALELWEMRQWGSLERELAAGQLNTLNDILRFTPQWKKTPPSSAIVGPTDWWPEEQLKNRNKKLQKSETHKTESPSVGDVMAAFGWSGT